MYHRLHSIVSRLRSSYVRIPEPNRPSSTCKFNRGGVARTCTCVEPAADCIGLNFCRNIGLTGRRDGLRNTNGDLERVGVEALISTGSTKIESVLRSTVTREQLTLKLANSWPTATTRKRSLVTGESNGSTLFLTLQLGGLRGWTYLFTSLRFLP